MNSLVSMVMPEEATISCPSFRHVMRMGMSPEDTTQAMYISFPMDVGGKSNGWISGGTESGREEEDERTGQGGEGTGWGNVKESEERKQWDGMKT